MIELVQPGWHVIRLYEAKYRKISVSPYFLTLVVDRHDGRKKESGGAVRILYDTVSCCTYSGSKVMGSGDGVNFTTALTEIPGCSGFTFLNMEHF